MHTALENTDSTAGSVPARSLTTRDTRMNLVEHPGASTASRALAAVDTILVVDDYPALCDVAALLLSRFGYRVLTATNGEQAKRIARETHIDLLLTDVEMPGMLGDELAAWFRATRPQTAIIFMSGNPMQLRRLQPCHFVEKPFIHLDTLVKEVREVLNHGRTEMPATAAA
jgi:CheY-like chemotaxis protein